MIPQVLIDYKIAEYCPEMKIALVRAKVVNGESPQTLWDEIDDASQIITDKYELLDVNKRPAVAQTRSLYRHLGKDPNRYRVASEALCRRIIKGLGLYRVNALVDLINLISIRSGYPISGLDGDKIKGNCLRLGVGETGEHYEGIGRGLLNIENMPVYRDELGGIATPTSDEVRTKLDEGTTLLQMNINAFAIEQPIEETLDYSIDLLEKYASATEIEIKII